MLASTLVALLTITAQSADAPAATADTPDPNEVICRNERRPGTRIARERVCLTRADWAARGIDAGKTLEETRAGNDFGHPRND